MSSLKQLRTRIKSVISTQKITSAMKMVAAAKLRRCQENAENAHPYAEQVRSLVKKALHFGDFNQMPLMAKGSDAPSLIILFAADRGLCGGFNSNMFKTFRRQAQEFIANKKNFYCIAIGSKAYTFLKRNYAYNILEKIQPDEDFNFDTALKLSEEIRCLIDCREIGHVNMIFTSFKNILTLIPSEKTLVPLHDNETIKLNGDESPLFEPKAQNMLEDLLQLFMSTQLYFAHLQSQASEHASRMAAMDNATRNADEMISTLKLTYNRTRQATITRELIEIISGAETSAA